MSIERNQSTFNVLDRLTEVREQRNMSVYKLAKLSGIAQSSIATWYSKHLYPPIDKLEIICKVLGISLADFFNTDSIPNSITDSEGNLIQKYRLLNDNEQKTIDELIITILNAHKK